MPASYPNSAKSFTSKSNGQTIDASHVGDLQDEVTAIETDLVAGLPVARGGTGNTSITANRIPYGNGSSALQTSASLTFDGTTLTIPGQIAFPASQSASSGANTLDDYEEGTWTPVLGGAGGTSGQTYSTQAGNYIKIGRVVVVQFYLVLTAKGTITGNLQLQALPFTTVNSASAICGGEIAYFANMGTNLVKLSLLTVSNSSVANVLLTTAAASSVSNGATANVADNSEVAGTFTYFAAS